jgi:hypothetical protein
MVKIATQYGGRQRNEQRHQAPEGQATPCLLHMRLRGLGETYNETGFVLPGNDKLHDDCVICTEAFRIDDLICKLPCGHIHHSKCITKWMSCSINDGTCPTCRHPVHQSVPAASNADCPEDGVAEKLCKREAMSLFQQSPNFDLILKRALRAKKENWQRKSMDVGSIHSTVSTHSCCSRDWLADDIEEYFQVANTT